MKRFPVTALLLTAAMLLPCHNLLLAQSSVPELLSSIERHNLQLQSLRHSQEAEVLDLKAENKVGGPSVEYSPFYQEGFTGVAESELIVSEEFDFPTRYAARHKQVRLEQQLNDRQYLSARREVLLEAQLLCYDLIRTRQLIDMLRQRLHDSEALQELFAKRMEAGDANILELNKVKLDRMEVLTRLSQVENEHSQFTSRLTMLNGGKEFSLTDQQFPEQLLDPDFEAFITRALAADADVLAAQASLQASQHQVSLSRQEWLPNLSIGYRRNTERGEAVNGFLVGASFPLLSTSARVKAAKQRQYSAELDLQEQQLASRQQLEAQYNELRNLHRVLDHSDVEMMQQMLQLLSKALQHGEISALQYYTEISSIYQKLEDHIDVHCQSTKLYASLYSFQL